MKMNKKLIEIGDEQNLKMVRLLNETIRAGWGFIKINVSDYEILDMEQNIRSRLEGTTQSRKVPYGKRL